MTQFDLTDDQRFLESTNAIMRVIVARDAPAVTREVRIERAASVPMGSAAEALYQAMADAGDGDLDFSAMIGLLDSRSPR